MREALIQDHLPYIGKLNLGCSSRTSARPRELTEPQAQCMAKQKQFHHKLSVFECMKIAQNYAQVSLPFVLHYPVLQNVIFFFVVAGRHFFIRKMKIKMADRKKHVLSNRVGDFFDLFNPNSIRSYKIIQKLSPKHAARGVAQSPYPTHRHGKACLSKQPPWRAAGDPRLARGRSRVRAPGPADALRALFFSTLPSFLLREIVFFSHLPHQTCETCG